VTYGNCVIVDLFNDSLICEWFEKYVRRRGHDLF